MYALVLNKRQQSAVRMYRMAHHHRCLAHKARRRGLEGERRAYLTRKDNYIAQAVNLAPELCACWDDGNYRGKIRVECPASGSPHMHFPKLKLGLLRRLNMPCGPTRVLIAR
jgi:hypothetical protein